MIFAHDTEESLLSTVALVNTLGLAPDGEDLMVSGEQLDDFVTRWMVTGSRAHDDEELSAVRRLRTEVHQIWVETDEDQMVHRVNDLLARAKALPRIVRHDDWGWHLHATSPSQPLDTRLGVEAAMAFVDVVRGGELERLRVCEGEGCRSVLIDLSKNRSRRYCEAGCGNRAHVAAYRARLAARRA